MKKFACSLVAFLLSQMICLQLNAQNATISGNVKAAGSKENAAAVSVTVKNSSVGTYTDDKGNFNLSIQRLPVTIVFSGIGFETRELDVNQSDTKISIELKANNRLGQEVVVSASRVPEKILESPVSIERVNASAIRNAPAANYYDILKSLKGVDVTTSSLTFVTPTTRGFNSSGNTRFNQLIDGMDNQAPGLNFPVSSLIGLSELDIDNIELLSGASSALYGSGGMNGTLLMTSKNPFKYQGISVMVKQGIMHLGDDERDLSGYNNFSIRWANKVSDKFAFKFNAEYIQAKDWLASDYRNYSRLATGGNVTSGTRESDPNYDGINIYGDETTTDIRNISSSVPWLANLPAAPVNVSRTGYTENQVINPVTRNLKLGGSLHYKITPGTEATLAGYWGNGNTTYTGSERYSLENFKMGQYKLELNNKNWALRAYTTQEDAGDSYNTTIATRLFNESWKPSVYYDVNNVPKGWYIDYTSTYLNAKLNGLSDAAAHAAARTAADQGRPEYNSDQFKKSFDSIRKKSISEGGAKLLDKSDLYTVEGNYNLSSITAKVADVIVGGVFKRYVLNSEGTLFADKPGEPITTDEYGAFAQATRKITNNFKLAVSGRYDKNQNFDGRFTPRVTATYKLAEFNHLRLSYQTAYRFPSNQQQWIDLYVGAGVRLLGSNEYFASKYNFSNQLYDLNSFSEGQIVKYNPVQLKPEAISSYELGYKGLLNEGKMLIDMYGYYGQYQDFIGRKLVAQFKDGVPTSLSDTSNRYYSLPVNSTDKVKTFGFGLSVDYRLQGNFSIGANVSSDQLKDVPENFVAYFNSPKYKANLSFSNSGFGPSKRLGFSIGYRWQQAMFYEGDFATGNLPDIHNVDAQVSIKLPSTKSIIKLGANNLLNSYYYNAIGNSRIGGLYYVSFGFNVY
jgi:outer membrane receptor protein involved in Fe transport